MEIQKINYYMIVLVISSLRCNTLIHFPLIRFLQLVEAPLILMSLQTLDTELSL